MRRGGIVMWAAVLCTGSLAACGGGGSGTTSSQTSATASTAAATVTAPPPAANPQRGRRRGTLLQVVAPTVRLNGAGVSSRTDLHDHDLLETLDAGEANFSLDTKVKMCTTLRGSRLEVEPNPGTLIRWDQGSSICVTAATGGTATFGAGGRVVLTAADPVFQITVADGQTTVKVDKGFVSVGVTGGGRQMIVGVNEQTHVGSGGPQGIDSFDAAQDPNAVIFNQLEKSAPPLAYTRPSPGGSAGLQAIIGRRQLNVSTSAETGSGERAFIESALAKLSRVWGLNPPNFVGDGQGDVSVTTQPGETGVPAGGGPLATLPLFESNGTTWSMGIRADAGLTSALRVFLRNYLNTGDYGAAFDQSFGGELPQYDILRPILFGG